MTSRVFATKVHETPVEIGVARKDRKKLSEELGVALADTYMVYGDTRSVHWNATGPLFFSVHQLTEMQYKDLAEAKANSERARAAAEKADAEAQKQLWSKIDALKSKAESAQKRLDELKRSTEEQASRLKSEVERLVA